MAILALDRVRIGVANKTKDKQDAAEFVLKNFSRAELKKLPELRPVITDQIMRFIDGNFEADTSKPIQE